MSITGSFLSTSQSIMEKTMHNGPGPSLSKHQLIIIINYNFWCNFDKQHVIYINLQYRPQPIAISCYAQIFPIKLYCNAFMLLIIAQKFSH